MQTDDADRRIIGIDDVKKDQAVENELQPERNETQQGCSENKLLRHIRGFHLGLIGSGPMQQAHQLNYTIF
jgi:hypothetical protein